MIYGLASLAWHADSGDIVWASLWYLAACALVAWLAHGKGRYPPGFFAVALVFTPVVGLLSVIAAHDLKTTAEAQQADEIIKQMLTTITLNMDGIRGHLAVSKQTANPSPARAPAPQGTP